MSYGATGNIFGAVVCGKGPLYRTLKLFYPQLAGRTAALELESIW
jgi:hypothetical protein